MGTNQHVTKKNGEWRVIGEGNSRATKKFATQKEEIDYGRKVAINQQAELVIHGINGRIRDMVMTQSHLEILKCKKKTNWR